MIVTSIPFSFLRGAGGAPTISTGADGDLVVLNGQTFDIPEGAVRQYNSITVNAGGTIRITGSTGAWTEIACKTFCVINGTILSRSGYDGQATHTGGTFTKTSVFGLGPLSYSISQVAGGSGGVGGSTTASSGKDVFYRYGGAGAGQSSGMGGGGGGGAASPDNYTSTATVGGAGEVGTARSLVAGANGSRGGDGYNYPGPFATGGAGGGGNGGNGNSASGGTIYATAYAAGGGGGGYRGHHGKGLVLFVEGTLSGTGTINCSGRTGFSAGNGGVLSPGALFGGGKAGGGGGGGGGAGGSGGNLILRYRFLSTLPSVSVAGGGGGGGGAAGQSWQNGFSSFGTAANGGGGATGNAGTSSVAVIV